MSSSAYPLLGCGRISHGLLDGCNLAANVMFRSVNHHGAPTNFRSASMFVSSTTFPAWTSQKKRLPDQHPTTIKLAHLLCALYRRNSPLLYRWIISIGPHGAITVAGHPGYQLRPIRSDPPVHRTDVPLPALRRSRLQEAMRERLVLSLGDVPAGFGTSELLWY